MRRRWRLRGSRPVWPNRTGLELQGGSKPDRAPRGQILPASAAEEDRVQDMLDTVLPRPPASCLPYMTTHVTDRVTAHVTDCVAARVT